MKLAYSRIVAVGLLVLTQRLYGQAATYPIVPDRPVKVGDVCDSRWVVERTTTVSISAGGQEMPPKVDKVAGEIAGRMEIKEIFPDGDPKVILLTVKTFKNTADKTDEVAANKVIEITRSADPATAKLTDGGDLSAAALALLQEAFSSHHDGPSDNDVFGSKTPRAVGDKWPVDAKKAAEQAAKSDVKLKAEDISGEMTLKGVEKVNGADALRVEGSMTAKNARPGNLPEELVLSMSDLTTTMSGLFPTDLTSPALESSTKADIHMKGTTGGATLDMVMHASSSQTTTPVKK
jgi:hypothetical protein